MNTAVEQLHLDLDLTFDDRAGRQVIRFARYSAYPRVSRDQRLRFGFASDATATTLRLSADVPERVGQLLRVKVRDLSGRATLDTLARVVSCSPRGTRFELKLELIEAHRPRFVRKSIEVPEEAISA